jgi:hypothetical protein
VTIFCLARPLSPTRILSSRASKLGTASLAAALLALLAIVPSAGAVVTEVGTAKVGLQPSTVGIVKDGGFLQFKKEWFETAQPESFANPAGSPVLHASNVYAVYWDPTDTYHGDWQGVIDGFLQGASVEGSTLGDVFAVDSQYTDTTNQPAYSGIDFRGAYTDTSPYPGAGCVDPAPLEEVKVTKIHAIACLTDQQVQQHLQAFVTAHGLPAGLSTVYYLLTPPGVTVCLDAGGAKGHCSDFSSEETYEHSFCSYHAAVNPSKAINGDASTILYGMIPWTVGGVGDGQLGENDQTEAINCQDGGFDPSTRPIEAEEGPPGEPPRVQEPNQVSCPSPDGFCDTGLADLIVNQIGVEQQNIITNPMLNAWQDSGGNESTDECRNFFAPSLGGSSAAKEGSGAGDLFNQSLGGHGYYLNTAFNLAALRLNYPGVPCLPGVRLEPSFTTPNPVKSGDIVGFDGMESDISLNAAVKYVAGSPAPNYATYSWSFGDGSASVAGYAPGAPACETPWLSPCAASVFHSYQYGGTYLVTLTVTDVAGHTSVATNPITVVGPPPPAPGASAGASSGATTPGGGSSGSPATVPAPVAAAAIVSKSLKAVAKKGLVVRYSVNEQVAGRFEVLIPRSVAKRLGISGPPATGLPAGSPPEVVVTKAILVTTKGGRSTLTIPFSKRTSGRLRHTRKLTVTLRLIVRNAAAHSPASTTVVTAATLSH